MKLKIITTCLLAATAALSQTNQVQICDQQATPNCITLQAPAALTGSYPLILPGANGAGMLSNDGAGHLSWASVSGYLPLTGATMTGAISLSGGFGNGILINYGTNIEAIPDFTGTYHQSQDNCTFPPAYSSSRTYNLGDIASFGGTTYTSSTNGNTGHPPPNSSYWLGAPGISVCIDDRPRMDWFGGEWNFVRIKGKGATLSGGVWTNASIGNYFDLTRYGPTGVLPLGQMQLVDSSFNTLWLVDETAGYPNVKYTYTGLVGIGMTPTYYLDVNGAARATGLMVAMPLGNDGSGYSAQFGGGLEMTAPAGNILSKGTSWNAIVANAGGVAGNALYALGSSIAPATPGAGYGGLGWKSGSVYWYWNGSSWASVDLSATGSGVTSVSAGTGISVSGTTAVTVTNTGVTSLGGSTGALNLAAGNGISISGLTVGLQSSINIAGQYQSTATGTNNAFVGSNFQILGNGTFGTNSYVNAAQGFYVNGVPVINSSGQWVNGGMVMSLGGYTGALNLAAGTGISVSGLTITNTGVASLGGFSGALSLVAGNGISISGLTVGLQSSLSIAGQYQSTATGANNAFVGANFQILGNGTFGTNSYVNAATGFYANGVQVINAAQQWVGGFVNTSSGFGVTSGGSLYSGQTWSVVFSGGFSIAGTGCSSTLYFRGGILVSCS